MRKGVKKEQKWTLKTIARIHTDFPTKFGVPRQSGLVDTKAEIIFEPGYRSEEAVRELEMYSHLWLIWEFSESVRDTWSPTVRPPRLGGNKRVGVFATRSPFRPNPLGLSCVRLESIEYRTSEGPVLHLAGADMVDGTPIYDIKPYLPYVDAHPEAKGGFAEEVKDYRLEVEFPEEWLKLIPEEKRAVLLEILAQDVRPSYQKDEERIYGMEYAGFDIRFRVCEGVLRVCQVCEGVSYEKEE